MSEERLTGNYKLVVCYVKDIGEGMYIESQPSPAVGPVSVNNGWLKWTNIPVSTDPDVVKRTLYRTVSNGEIFYYLTTIDDNTTTTYEDHNFDEALGDELDENKIAPPNCDFIAEMGGVMFYIGLSSDESKIAYSTQGYPYYVPALNRLEMGTDKGAFTGVVKIDNMLILFKERESWALMGVDASTFTIQCISPHIGCVNSETLQYLSGYCFFVSRRGLEIMTSGGQFLSPPLYEDIANTNLITASPYCRSGVDPVKNQYWAILSEVPVKDPNGQDVTPDPMSSEVSGALGGCDSLWAFVFDVDEKSASYFSFAPEGHASAWRIHSLPSGTMLLTFPATDDEYPMLDDQSAMLLSPSGFNGKGADFPSPGYPICAEAVTNYFDYGSPSARKTVRGINMEYAWTRPGGAYMDRNVSVFDIQYNSDSTGEGSEGGVRVTNTAIGPFVGMDRTNNFTLKKTFGISGRVIKHRYTYAGPTGLVIYREAETVRLDGGSNAGRVDRLAHGDVPT